MFTLPCDVPGRERFSRDTALIMLHAGIEDLTYNFTNRCLMFHVFVRVKLVVLGKMTSLIPKNIFLEIWL